MPEASVNGVRLVYQTRGAGTPLLLICGTGQTAAMWEVGTMLPTLLQAGCSVTTYDNRGIPPSACPEPPWAIADMADDAIALIEHLEIGPCHVLGASLGAMTTQTVALKRPDLVRSAILYVGGGNMSRAAQLTLEGQVELLRRGVEQPQAAKLAGMLEAALTPAQRQDDAMVDQIVELAGALTTSFGPGGEYGQIAADAAWAAEDHLAELADLAVPCLVIAAEHDAFFPPVLMKRAADTIPNATYVEMPNSAHIATDPAAIQIAVDAMRDFLSGQH